MPGIYRPRHPERTALYRVFFHHFERFVAEYESRFEFFVTEGGVDAAGAFYKLDSFDDGGITEVFSREVLGFLVGQEILSPEWAERLLGWRHTDFDVNNGSKSKYPDYNIYDGSLAAGMLMIAGRALSYRTGFFTSDFPEARLKEFFRIPERYNLICFTPAGIPEAWPQTPAKKTLAEIVVFVKFE